MITYVLHMKLKTPIFLYINPIKKFEDDSDMRPKFERGKLINYLRMVNLLYILHIAYSEVDLSL